VCSKSQYYSDEKEITMIKNLSMIGLGKLGAPLAACWSAKGFRVTAVDVDARKVEAIKRGVSPIFEPGVDKLLQIAGDRISSTQDAEGAVLESEITFIVVPTPSEPDGGFSLRYVLPACESIGRALRAKADYHLVILTSTVMPGATGGIVQSTLEQVSGKRCGRDFGLCYSPEFIALGSVIRDFLNPDFVLIGESDPFSGAVLAALYMSVCENSPPIARMNFVNAEITKLAVNTFMTTKITFANMLARICERLPGANVDSVTSALGLDSRIGRKYLKGAVGYGGPCFPRDNVALASLARGIGAPAGLAEATDCANRDQVRRLTELVKRKLPPAGTVGILGLAYKPDTDVVEESQGLLLGQELVSEGIPVVGYDPSAMDATRQMMNGAMRFAESLEDCVKTADVIVVTTPWEMFRNLNPALVERPGTPRVLIDCWRMLNKEEFISVVDYIALGVGTECQESASESQKNAKNEQEVQHYA
jgi:UDPglucose 6-dehydrogenase